MWFVGIGTILILMNVFGIGPVGAWTWKEHWWIMLAPFALAVAWWSWADATGHTQRKAMQKMDEKREARRQKSLDALGLGTAKGKKGGKRSR